MKTLGTYQDKEGRLYDLIYFPDGGLAQAFGPLTLGVGAAPIAFAVHASSESEARELLIEKLAGIKVEGPTFLTISTNTSGDTKTTSTTLPPEWLNGDPEAASKNASDLIVKDNPDLKPIEEIVAQHVNPLLSGVSSEEKIDTEVVKKANKVEITIKYAPRYYIGRDAYLGDHVGSMGPRAQNFNLLVRQTWNEFQNKYEIDLLIKELQNVAKKIDAIEDEIGNLHDAALIEKAAKEIREGRGPKALRILSGVSKAVLEVSREIGTKMVTELIMKMTDLK